MNQTANYKYYTYSKIATSSWNTRYINVCYQYYAQIVLNVVGVVGVLILSLQ